MVDLPVGADAKVTSPSSSLFDSYQFDCGAEQVARKLIQKVQLTAASEERRARIIDYVQRFIRNRIGAQVFPYGSVPLKTYLPDGDIDLTAFGGVISEDKFADEIKFALEEESKNKAAEFVVKDVQLIHAEVKLVKCIVQDIVVDISLNQIGGLSALCFLEQVDRFIGKDHLFKRSIILTKAWCYYESRILGAHHGLISTYALEIMVLYIFHLFYSTLNGPLSVLHKFLDYFSKFDWETYCISLKGPVRLSSLPDVVPEILEECCGDLMLTSDFLSSCTKEFSIPSKTSRGFQQKHLNIIDPLKETNNLGRSVNKANFYRIRSAFNYGAQRLDRILLQPEHVIPKELDKFFSDSMARHGCGKRHDVQDFIPPPTGNGAITNLPVCKAELPKNDIFSESHVNHTHLATDLATSGVQGLRISSDTPDTMVTVTESAPATVKIVCAPHLFFSNSKTCNGSTRSRKSDSDHRDDPKESVSSAKANAILLDTTKTLTLSGHSMNMKRDQGSASRIGMPESLNILVDLTGDYDSYLYGLEYGRWCTEYKLAVPSSPVPPSRSPPLFQIKNPPDDVQSLSQLPTNGFSFRHPNSFHPGSPVYPMPHLLLPGVIGWEEMPKPRGMGTYFPNTNQPPQGYRPSTLKGRSQAPPRSIHNKEQNPIFIEPSMLDRSLPEPALHSESRQPQSSHSHSLTMEREPEGTVEFGVGQAFGTSIQEISRRQGPVSSSPRSFPSTPRPQPGFSKEHDRMAMRSSYSLKDEDDFPPLSV
ncbi:hypothetical protein F511_14074 [Dorcoceras hygrometricum]|uniref:Polymerase nucleotidyl transferase domain-containing protein n=1 Tax=Dorcoceras hygrometricum TaxID=472368 RepID=A0A2Z7C9T5_9LAMI|nr:hypothetical protein F511_14074 [Dorcoceras hygrometricum]